ncbi:hypothetical protein RSAG8_07166, partial [Rhizoctonia solani AG-8 WAC10335]
MISRPFVSKGTRGCILSNERYTFGAAPCIEIPHQATQQTLPDETARHTLLVYKAVPCSTFQHSSPRSLVRAIMSKLAGMPRLPASVGGQPIPDFMNFEVIDEELPPLGEVPEEFDFSIKKSPVFGQESGDKFDEGAVWHPLREVKFALSDKGLGHYRGHYPGRSTA